MNVCSNSSLMCSLTFCSTGSPGAISWEPPRSSSHAADHETFMGLPSMRLRGGATGMCSPSGADVRFS